MAKKINPKRISEITINFISAREQRLSCYRKSGCADYFLTKDQKTLQINVTRTRDWRKQWLVLIHELAEIAVVLNQKISFQAIDEFDLKSESEDPGSEKEAPYHGAHIVALLVEGQMARELGVPVGSY